MYKKGAVEKMISHFFTAPFYLFTACLYTIMWLVGVKDALHHFVACP